MKTTKTYKMTTEGRLPCPSVPALHLPPMPTTPNPCRGNASLARCIAVWLVAMLWNAAVLATPSQIIERAFVVDLSGQMTLDQAKSEPQRAYTGALLYLLNTSVVWVRLRVAPSEGPLVPAAERLRFIPLWTQSLTLYDPLQRDNDGSMMGLAIKPASAPFTVHTLSIPAGADARDLWLRFQPSGPTYLNAVAMSAEAAAARTMSEAVLQGVTLGIYVMMMVLGLIAWMADRKGIGHTMFTKQVFNLLLAGMNADLLLTPYLPGRVPWPDASGTYALEGLRLMNMAASIWFFMKVLELLKAPRWVLTLQYGTLAVIVCCFVPLAIGQLALVRTTVIMLYFTVLIGLVVGSLKCQREPLHPVTAVGLARRVAERLGFGLVLGAAWIASLPIGVFKTQELSFFGVLIPIATCSAVGVLLVVGWRHIRADRQRQVEQLHRAELNALALDFERSERQRQQEFMTMLTHELKAPLSTLGMVIGSPAASASMQRHAEMALASMRQVIDHCAQSADADDASALPKQVACSLAVEIELRCAAQADQARIGIAPPEAVPSIQADPRMLAIIFNNLLDNALKYSPPGTPVNVALVRECNPEGAVQRLSVTNEACEGPLPDDLRLFQKYYRGDAVQRINGSGLGLHLSRLLARRQGGDLQYKPNARKVTFTLVFPESLPVAAATQ